MPHDGSEEVGVAEHFASSCPPGGLCGQASRQERRGVHGQVVGDDGGDGFGVQAEQHCLVAGARGQVSGLVVGA